MQKKTKIVATLGPASSSPEVMEQMIQSGVDVFRINFSHADYEDVTQRIQMIRSLNENADSNTIRNSHRHSVHDISTYYVYTYRSRLKYRSRRFAVSTLCLWLRLLVLEPY